MAVFKTMPAKVKVLSPGYLSAEHRGKVSATISLVQDNAMVMIVDPGFLEDEKILVDKLKEEGLFVDDVTVVCITHSHIDHYKNVGMFSKAKILDYAGLWNQEGGMEDWQERFTENIQIIKTPGHDYTSLTLFVKTDDGVVAICGDVFWKENYPEVDPYASDLKKLDQSRKLVVQMSQWIIPGHGSMYKTHNVSAKWTPAPLSWVANRIVKVLVRCKKCHRPFLKAEDRCICQEWLCYNCCECEDDCEQCNCSHKR